MIKTLKRRFVILAMVSLALLLAAIVAGMNIMNYNKVISDADERIAVIQANDTNFISNPLYGLFGREDGRGRRMSRDEAEELRFFTVLADGSGNVVAINTERISAVDDTAAIEIANKALSSGNDNGFIGELRYGVSLDGSYIKMAFLDCGRVLDSYRDFLRASIIMSLIGLLLVFFIILYFSGRIVKPVAESYEKQKRFITDAGHEIKTPLAIIKADADLMKMDLGGEDKKSLSEEELSDLRNELEEINNQTDRLGGLTNDLVYLSRMEENANTLVTSDVPISDILTESVISFAALAKEKGVEIVSDIEAPVFTKGNTEETEKLISILMDNAVKYSEDNSQISIRLTKDAKNANLEIKNKTKENLDNESLSHVFERFYRTDSSRNSETGGHGIGLSVAKAIVTSCGGSINAYTEDGSEFIIKAVLPLS